VFEQNTVYKQVLAVVTPTELNRVFKTPVAHSYGRRMEIPAVHNQRAPTFGSHMASDNTH